MQSPTARRLIAALLALLVGVLAGAYWWPRRAAVDDGTPAMAGVTVRFASVDEGRAVLGASDDWIVATGPLQRAVLTGRPDDPGVNALRAWQADAVQPWPQAEQARWQRALAQIAPALNRLALPLPPQVLLVRTNGRESSNQPHTRGAAVVLPERFEQQGFSDAEVLAHELWHLSSRAHPELAERLYALIGFEPVGELEWPQAWQPLRITNQDAPHLNHAMRVALEGRERWVMPVVLSEEARPAADASLLGLMETRLLEVQPGRGGAPTRAVMAGDEPVWFPIDTAQPFLERLGGNTDYTQHPEEVIADNIMFIVSGREVANPALLRRIEQALKPP